DIKLKSSEETDFLGGIFEKFSLSSKDSEGAFLHYQRDFDETLTENYRGFESILHSERKDQSETVLQPWTTIADGQSIFGRTKNEHLHSSDMNQFV
ncbi:unnamed protein product, partial [Hymenolepis diminuta]